MAELVVTQPVAADQQTTWDALTDWDVHHRWMLFTRAEGGHAEGESLAAFTGVGKVGFTDTMRITVWEPPDRAVVRHTGKVVRGSGAFEVEAVAPGRSRVVWSVRWTWRPRVAWSEWIDLPLGVVGRLGWPVVRLPLRFFVQLSLKRFARYVEGGR